MSAHHAESVRKVYLLWAADTYDASDREFDQCACGKNKRAAEPTCFDCAHNDGVGAT